LLVGGGEGVISRWGFDGQNSDSRQFGWRVGHAREVCGIAWMPDGKRFVTASRDGSVAMWEASQFPLDLEQTVVTGRGQITGIAYSADGKSLVSFQGGTQVSIVNTATGAQRPLTPGPFPISHPYFAEQGKRLLGLLNDNHVGIWDSATGRRTHKLKLPPGDLADLTALPGGLTAAVAVRQADGKGIVKLIDVMSGRFLPRHYLCPTFPKVIRFAPDGKLLLITFDSGDPVLWGLTEEDDRTQSLAGFGSNVGPCAFSPSGDMLAMSVASRGHIHLFDMAAHRVAGTLALSSYETPARDLAWSPDSRLLAVSTTGGEIELWHVATRRLLYAFHLGTFSAKAQYLRFSPDGQTLAVSMRDPDERGNSVVFLFPLGDGAAKVMQ
jgi:WD40 repeat protein